MQRRIKKGRINDEDYLYGNAGFSVGTLEALIEAGHEVCLVVTQPDKPKGRGKEMQPTPVKAAAMKHGIPVYQPKKDQGS